jgi:hypothetical protein
MSDLGRMNGRHREIIGFESIFQGLYFSWVYSGKIGKVIITA